MQVIQTFIEYLLCARRYAIHLELSRGTSICHLLRAGKGILDEEQLLFR